MATNKKTRNLNIASKILIKPWITETTALAVDMNKYFFKVARKATKKQVEQAIEKIYKVTVVSVNTINVPGKVKMRGNKKGKRASYKKAIVTLKKGDSINLYAESKVK